MSQNIDRVQRRESIQFEYKPSKEEEDINRQEALQTMHKMCTETQNDVRPGVPGLFNKLIRQLRNLDAESLKVVHSTASTICDKAELVSLTLYLSFKYSSYSRELLLIKCDDCGYVFLSKFYPMFFFHCSALLSTGEKALHKFEINYITHLQLTT